MVRARPLVVGLLSVLLANACANSVSTTAPPTVVTATTTASVLAPTASPSAPPSPTLAPSPTLPSAPADAEAFWAIAGDTMRRAGQTFLTGKGPTDDRIQYELTASAALIADAPIVVCIDGVEYEGPNGFEPAPGTFSCGVDAFVDAFRALGFPVAGYSPDFEQNKKIKEKVSVDPDGRWRWDYSADSPQFSGPVSATVWLDPASGKIVEATRTDPVGKTTWTIDYDATFPPVALPGT